jgi:hypothetical protein
LGLTGGDLHTHITYANLGPETVDGVPVWHVHVSVFILGLTPADYPALEDTYVSQSDNTTVRSAVEETVQFNWGGKLHTIHETSQTGYSRYGQKVHIKLPLACKPSLVQASTPISELVPAAGLFLSASWSRLIATVPWIDTVGRASAALQRVAHVGDGGVPRL